MYRRLSIRLLLLALFTFFTLPAFAQFTRDNAANKKIDEAINEHYLATDFDKAEAVLTGTINACGDKCSPGVIAKAWMYVGIVRGSGKSDQNGAKDAFQKALAIDPNVKLDTQLATPETQTTFGGLGGTGSAAPAQPAAQPAAASDDDSGASVKGGIKCTPDVREVQTRRPIPMQCTSDEEATSMELRYKPFGGDWKTVRMKKSGSGFRGQIPCDATGTAGELKVYVRANDAQGESVDSFGSKSKPDEIQVSETTSAAPPAYDGEQPPARCVAQEECPPDFPGCGTQVSKRGGKDWGAACDNSTECKEGLLCTDGTCEEAPSCDTNADCETGTCVDNKCSVGSGGGGGGATYKKNWIGIHFAQDIAFVGGSNVCSAASQASNGYACYASGTTDQPYNGEPYPGGGVGGINTGTVFATHRLLLSFDHALTRNIELGVRAGFAFGGGPPAGKTDANPSTGTPASPGTSFLPAHLEGRLSYWFGKNALAKKGLRPYIHVGGGLAQVDAKVKVPVAECSGLADDGSATAPAYLCSMGAPGAYTPGTLPTQTLDAWRKMGQGFITAGGGVMYAFTNRLGLQLNVNLMVMLPSSGFVIQPSLGLEYGL